MPHYRSVFSNALCRGTLCQYSTENVGHFSIIAAVWTCVDNIRSTRYVSGYVSNQTTCLITISIVSIQLRGSTTPTTTLLDV